MCPAGRAVVDDLLAVAWWVRSVPHLGQLMLRGRLRGADTLVP